jgi:hypothetical protein
MPLKAGGDEGEASPIFGVKIPAGYRGWKLISVAREEGDFNDLRAQLGNNIVIKAYLDGTLPFPDGAIIVPGEVEERNRSRGKPLPPPPVRV